jgi:hypothetical protein
MINYSLYGFIFNATLREFNIEEAVDNFISFVGPEGELVLATVKSEDNTRDRLKTLEEKYPNFKVVESNLDITKTNRFDGLLKTEALNACSNELRIIVDCDERFVKDQRPKWDAWAAQLLNNKQLDGFLVPVLDLFGSKDKIRADRPVGQKFRLHKSSVHSRGVPSFAEMGNGLFRTDMSDSSDPLDAYGNLSKFASLVNPAYLMPQFIDLLDNVPMVIHHGFLDLKWKAKIGREFWAENWSKRSGKQEDVAVDEKQFDSVPVCFHNLKID